MATIIKEHRKNTTTLILGLLTAVLLIGLLFILYMNNHIDSSQTPVESTDIADNRVSAEFQKEAAEFARVFHAGNTEEAIAAAQNMIASSTSSTELGQASISYALAKRINDPAEATRLFKEIARNEQFLPLTRSFAIWYTIEIYFGNRDADFAANHIFTGPEWEVFVDEDFAEDTDLMYRVAAINALQASLDLQATVQTAMRLAAESSALLTYDSFSTEYKDQVAQDVLDYIAFGENVMVGLEDRSNPQYTGNEYLTLAIARNSKALALDTLYASGYLDNLTTVTDAYDEALATIIDYNLSTVHRFFVRYNYADFLARTDFEANTATIAALLVPMGELNSTNGRAAQNMFRSRLQNSATFARSQRYSGHPETMRKLATISPEFLSGLRTAGINEEDIASTQSDNLGNSQ